MEMGNNFVGLEGYENFLSANQVNEQFQTIQVPPFQMGHEVGEAVKSAMKSATLEMIEAVRLQCAKEFEGRIPLLEEAVRSQCAQEFRAIIPLLEEVKKMVHSSSSRSSPHQAESSASRTLQLCFVGTLPDQLATSNDIQDEGASLKVELHDCSGSRVEVGSESIKIKIVVLDGDFEVEENWTEEYFTSKIALPRKDRGPLLKGKCEISMSKGQAVVSDIAFTDNSSRTAKNGNFRLGAQVIRGLPPGVFIKEAVSDPFQVKERRGQYFQKHKPPSLDDDVWCLKNIAEKGKIRFLGAKVNKVKDFLQLYHTDEMKLKNIAQFHGKKWQNTVDHAKSCLLTSTCYRYCDDEIGVDLVLDCIFKIVSVTLNGQTSQDYDSLDASQKDLVNRVRRKAYEKRSELCVMPINQITKTCPSANQISEQAEPVCPSSIPQINMQYADAGGPERLPNSNYYAPSVLVSSQPGPPVDQTQGQDLEYLNISAIFNSLMCNDLNSNMGSTSNTSAVMLPSFNCYAPGVVPFQPRQPVDQSQTQDSYLKYLNIDGSLVSDDLNPNTASTSNTPAVIYGEDELVTRCSEVRGNSIRLWAVVKFKIILKLSIRQGPRALKRQKFV